MATIQTSIQLKDNMSPALNKIVGRVNNLLGRLNVVQTSGGKIGQSFDKAASFASKITKYVEIGNTQVTKMGQLINKNAVSEDKRLSIIGKITNLGKLDEQQKARITTLMNRSETLYRGIGVIQSGLVQKSLKRQQLEAQLVSLKKAEVVDNDKIKKTAADIDAITKRIALDEQKITNAKHARKAIQSQIANMGNADVTIATKRRQLQNQFNSLLGNELHREQQILGILQQSANAERQQIAAEEKIASAMNKKWQTELAGFDKAQAGMRKLILQSEQKTQREEQNAIRAAQLKDRLRWKEFDSAQASMRRLIVQAEKREQVEARAAQRQLEREQKKAAKVAETAARQNDYLTATRNVTREVEKSFLAQKKVAEQTAKANTNQQVSISLNRQLTSEKARLNALTTQLINTQAKINTLERQGKSVSTQMNAAKARKASLLNRIANQQQKILGVERQIKTETNNTANAQNRHNGYLRGAVNDANRLLTTLRNVVSVYAMYNGAKNTLGLADSMSNIRARIGLMNKGLYTTDEVMNKIYESAMRSRGSFLDTASLISRLGIRAPKIFTGGVDEIIAFGETINKMAVVSGTNANELNAALLQITQALGAGVVRGDEFKSISENIPVTCEATANFLKVATDEITELAHGGEITAEIFKNGVLSAAEKMTEMMKKMPVTWGQVWTMTKNYMLKEADSLLQKITKVTSSKRFVGFMENLAAGFRKFKEVASNIFDKMSNGIAYVYDNWKKLKPTIMGVVSALIAYKTAMTAASIVSAVYSFWQTVCAARHMLATGHTLAQTVAQHSLNAAMLACPLTWLIGGLFILGGVILSVMAATYDWEAANIDVWGTIKNVARFAAEKIKSAWEKLCKTLRPLIESIGKLGKKIGKTISKNWNKIIGVVSVLINVISMLGKVMLKVAQCIVKALEVVWDVLCWVFDMVCSLANAVRNNWSWIAPIVWSIVGALVAWKLALMAIVAWQAISKAAIVVWTGTVAAAKLAVTLFTAATWKQCAANIALGVSSLAAHWKILLIALAIALVITLIVYLIKGIGALCGKSLNAFGILCGLVSAVVSWICNNIFMAWNAILAFLDTVINIVVSLVEWFINVLGGGFDSFGAGVANLLGNIISWFLSLGQVVTTIIDAIFGTDWTAGLNNLKAEIITWGAGRNSTKLGRDYLKRNVSAPRVSIGEWYQSGYDFGERVYNFAANAGDELSQLMSGTDFGDLSTLIKNGGAGITDEDLKKALTGAYDGANPALDKIGKDVSDIAKNTDGGNGGVSGDVNYLRELAEREAINRYTLTDLNVNMTNNNSIGSGVDADDVGRRLWRALVNGALNMGERAVPF